VVARIPHCLSYSENCVLGSLMAWSRQHTPDDRQPPPLFVTAYADGKRHVSLLEHDRTAPAWFKGDLVLQIESPGGTQVQADLHDASRELAYTQCLGLVGREFVWRQEPESRPANVSFELWSQREVEIEGDANWLRVVDNDRVRGKNPFENGSAFVAVVRNEEGTVAYSLSGAYLFLDVRHSGDNEVYVPNAIVDTGLPGTFWGYCLHNNRPASERVAWRLLRQLVRRRKDPIEHNDPIMAVAAAHALLTHRDYIGEFGERVLNALGSVRVYLPDVEILITLLKLAMQRLAPEDARQAISTLGHYRPVFGETLRWVSAQFSTLAAISRESENFDRDEFQSEFEAAGLMLSQSFIGGQMAVYSGEPSDNGFWGSYSQKKTLVT
jgi:hypothetical protein